MPSQVLSGGPRRAPVGHPERPIGTLSPHWAGTQIQTAAVRAPLSVRASESRELERRGRRASERNKQKDVSYVSI